MACNCVITVYTGDRKSAGTDANISIILHDNWNRKSQEISLDTLFHDDFERGQVDKFEVSEKEMGSLENDGKISLIQFWRDDSGVLSSSSWYLEKIEVENCKTNTTFVFPFMRWVDTGTHYFITLLDTSLPQGDPFPEQRKVELENKRSSYTFKVMAPGLPVEVQQQPSDEMFSQEYKFDLIKKGTALIVSSGLDYIKANCRVKALSDLNVLYGSFAFPVPKGKSLWQNDLHFGIQRICRLNNRLIELCTAIPDKFPVTDDMLKPLLEGLSIRQALAQKRLFICDLKVLEGVPSKAGCTLCAPIALLFVDKDQHLRPVAIQLFQEPGPDNPIFLPTDEVWLWTVVKMWYNNADAAYHQSHAHLGFTHLLMEGVAVTTNRQLSHSHPVFKILAPHFLYLIAINAAAQNSLLEKDGWVDSFTSMGLQGAYEIIKRGLTSWRLDVDGTLPEDLKRRGLDDPKVLPCYYFRDDALLYYNAIHKYVTAYLKLYYDHPAKLKEDTEIQAWVAELVNPRAGNNGGCGLLGVPGETSLQTVEQLAVTITSIIYTCSVDHAVVNFAQYDEYAFPPNYPALLLGMPPHSKEPLSEQDVVTALPDLGSILRTMTIVGLLSSKDTHSLGDFEVQYIYDPSALEVLNKFRQDLEEIGKTIEKRNQQRRFPFLGLEPDGIPNAISI